MVDPRDSLRNAGRAVEEAASLGDDDQADDADGPFGIADLPTSVEDLTTEAEPAAFDQTFTDDDASLRIQGNFDPTAGRKQVLPRVAYVLNYNLIYNESRGRWEPQKKSDLGGADVGGGPAIVAGTSFQVQADSTFQQSTQTSTAPADGAQATSGDQTSSITTTVA